MEFTLTQTRNDTAGRLGQLTSAHGSFHTPAFMPVGTLGTVKGVHQHELAEVVDAPVVLGNTYHLYLRPGLQVLEAAGGLHQFMQWPRTMLTDSGGYQVFSLGHNREISEEGVQFQSHIDGSYHQFTPEGAVQMQRSIGADIMMAFDECPPYPSSYQYAEQSMELTHRWLDRCLEAFHSSSPLYGYDQALFPILQGGTYRELRERSAAFTAERAVDGIAIGGLSVGEPAGVMNEVTSYLHTMLPANIPRYLMGVGLPVNLLESIHRGVDLFDCVLPSRNARHGLVYTANGIINIKNQKWEQDFRPLNEAPLSYLDEAYSRAYIRHLFKTNEALGPQITTLQNLVFYQWLMKAARHHLRQGDFVEWKNQLIPYLTRRL
jgi:queuine tRNA-ribosyltransferase